MTEKVKKTATKKTATKNKATVQNLYLPGNPQQYMMLQDSQVLVQ